MTSTETERLEDFKRILTFHLVHKIDFSFHGNVELFYDTPEIWCKFRRHQLHDKTINPFELIAKFNATGLRRSQVQAIFGKYQGTTKFMNYKDLIANDKSIIIYHHGKFKPVDEIVQHTNIYLLPYDTIKPIFGDPRVLTSVKDPTSGYYTKRQIRLIFNQITKPKKESHD